MFSRFPIFLILLLPLTLSFCMKVKLVDKALLDAITFSNSWKALGIPTVPTKVANPIFSPTPGHRNEFSSITIATATPGATIYYTTNGTIPDANSQLYNPPIGNVWSLAGKTIQAIAVKEGMENSDTIGGIYSYPPLKTGQTTVFVTGDNGTNQTGVAKSYTNNGDGTVTDNATGLVWQRCSRGQNNDATCSGTATHHSWSDAITYCNGLSLAGKTWRLPSVIELQTLVNYENSPTIDSSVFPSTITSEYHSSTEDATNTTNSKYVHFGSGIAAPQLKGNHYYIRCVSGFAREDSQNFEDNGNGTITDKATGLVWQKCTRGQTNDTNCTGTALADIWSSSISYCNGLNLAGRSWRLPNINELFTLMDHTKTTVPTIHPTFFPNTNNTYYWSSTTNSANTGQSFNAYYFSGSIVLFNKSNTVFTRCVSGP